jgi:CrcB protein
VIRIGLVGIFGAAGALSRYAIGVALAGRLYPYGTLAINVLGSFLLGLVIGGPGATRWSETTTIAVSIGFLGAFTTFSTFTNETMDLLRDGRATSALVYVFLSLVLGLAAAAIGWTVGRDLV